MASPGEPIVISDRAVVVAQIFYGVTIPLVVLATATIGYRLARISSRRSIWSDACITVGYILSLAVFGLSIPQAFLTPGPKSPAALLEGQKGSFLSIPIWGMAMGLIKASIGLTLLQILNTLWFRIFIWANIFLSAAYGFGNMWFILFSCRPLAAAWGDFADPTEAKCLPAASIRIAAVTGAVVSVLTDVMLSLAPLSFLWSLKRPLRERVVLGCLMSLGLLAGASSIVKNLIIADFGKPGLDMWAMNISISTWTALEMFLGVIAACTPFCKPLFERCLMAVGVSITGTKYGATPGYANYRRNNEQDTSRSKGAVTARKSQFESDEDPLATAIELRPPAARIYKHTDIRVQSGQISGGDLSEDRKHHPGGLGEGGRQYTP